MMNTQTIASTDERHITLAQIKEAFSKTIFWNYLKAWPGDEHKELEYPLTTTERLVKEDGEDDLREVGLFYESGEMTIRVATMNPILPDEDAKCGITDEDIEFLQKLPVVIPFLLSEIDRLSAMQSDPRPAGDPRVGNAGAGVAVVDEQVRREAEPIADYVLRNTVGLWHNNGVRPLIIEGILRYASSHPSPTQHVASEGELTEMRSVIAELATYCTDAKIGASSVAKADAILNRSMAPFVASEAPSADQAEPTIKFVDQEIGDINSDALLASENYPNRLVTNSKIVHAPPASAPIAAEGKAEVVEGVEYAWVNNNELRSVRMRKKGGIWEDWTELNPKWRRCGNRDQFVIDRSIAPVSLPQAEAAEQREAK